ncbi:protein of unknown function [Taphrina deformans PYCC 5710]|uniref:Wings apart-like protein C-terminal domain-containing protein n=1 Tax=Taphrina deformans (strain PYCC 5710 / ATCC 11124 / CBS 356.35 / IMI 108563 / JCM 9778 / NBRC 8474) TaxID=1097556 RepID=R4XM71_TAPDE|nr:protein of unknown function [Taphrina deformans PYCC 5710]|eukprot:CCG84395.1 protein of unknown function [Taphrina deformans PYCC 5710]
MRTPLKYSYGKRKRHSQVGELSWDETIDKLTIESPDSSLNQPGRPQDRSLTSPTYPRGLPVVDLDRTKVVPLPRKKATTSEKDIFDFGYREQNAKTRSRRSQERRRALENQDSHTGLIRVDEAKDKVKLRADSISAVTSQSSENPSAELKAPSLDNINSDRLPRDKGKAKASEPIDTGKDCMNEQVSLQKQFEDDMAQAIKLSKKDQSTIDMGRSMPQGSTYGLRRGVRRVSDNKNTTKPMSESPSKRILKRKSHGSYPLKPFDDDHTSFVRPFEIVGKSIEKFDQNTSDAEVDLEPPTRTQTPSMLVGRISYDPQPSPQKHDISGLFDNHVSATRGLDSQPRRLMHALKSSRNRIQTDVKEVPDSEEDSHSLERLLESAEKNLYEQSQQDELTFPDMSKNKSGMASDQEIPRTDESFSQSTRQTYSKQRSFLVDVPTGNFDDDLAIPATASPIVDTDSDASDQEVTSVGIKNVHELRQGGENKRFIGEASYLLEGLESGETMQSTLVELAHKLSSRDFARRFRAADLDETIWRSCKKVQDPISLFALTVILTVLVQHLEHPKLSRNQCNILRRAIDCEADIADYVASKSVKLSRMSKASILELRSEVANSDAFSGSVGGTRLSPRLLALIGLNLCCQTGLDVQDFLYTILKVVPDHFADLQPVLAEIQMVTSILEQIPPDVMSRVPRERLDPLLQLVVALCVDQSATTGPYKSPALCSFFRCFINLVNHETASARLLSHSSLLTPLLDFVVQSCADTGAQDPPDELALCLGLLICLAEECPEARATMSDAVDRKVLLENMRTALAKPNWKSVGGFIALLSFHLCRDTLTTGRSNEFDGQAKVDLKDGLRCLQDSIELGSDNVFTKNLQSFSDSIRV